MSPSSVHLPGGVGHSAFRTVAPYCDHDNRGRMLLRNSVKTKGKGKVHPRTGHEGPEREQMYSSTLPSTSALDGVGGQRHDPAALSPGKERDPVHIV